MADHLSVLHRSGSTSVALGVVPTIRGRELRVFAVRTPVRRFISIVTHVQDDDGRWLPLKAVQVTADALPALVELCQAAADVLPDLPPARVGDDSQSSPPEAA